MLKCECGEWVSLDIDGFVSVVFFLFAFDGFLGVVEALEGFFDLVFAAFALVYVFLDEVDQVVDVFVGYLFLVRIGVKAYKFSADGEVVEVFIEDNDEQVEVLGLAHADVGDLEGSLEAVHHFLAVFLSRFRLKIE